MKKISLLIFLLVGVLLVVNGQIFVPVAPVGFRFMPEHGFLPGKKFRIYPTINQYDFTDLTLRVELYDDRDNLKLSRTNCSDIPFTNTSEFRSHDCIYKVSQYLDSLFKQSGATLNLSAPDTLQVRLEGIDARLIGFGYIRVHGLCQMSIKFHSLNKTYCADITDADKHSPISPNALTTRKNGYACDGFGSHTRSY